MTNMMYTSAFIQNSTFLVGRPYQIEEVPMEYQSPVVLSPLEVWCLSNMDVWYRKSQTKKCPFLRRRFGDLLDIAEVLTKHLVIRKQCWPLMGVPQAYRPVSRRLDSQVKYRGLSREELRKKLLQDWKVASGKSYYVTGKLTKEIYRDDCLFLGDDPDMPIRGLRKYVGVAQHLFASEKSHSTLQSLEAVDDCIVARWTLNATLRLPWKPAMPQLLGQTTYHIDQDGLIEKHEESWNISAVAAFAATFFPNLL